MLALLLVHHYETLHLSTVDMNFILLHNTSNVRYDSCEQPNWKCSTCRVARSTANRSAQFVTSAKPGLADVYYVHCKHDVNIMWSMLQSAPTATGSPALASALRAQSLISSPIPFTKIIILNTTQPVHQHQSPQNRHGKRRSTNPPDSGEFLPFCFFISPSAIHPCRIIGPSSSP